MYIDVTGTYNQCTQNGGSWVRIERGKGKGKSKFPEGTDFCLDLTSHP